MSLETLSQMLLGHAILWSLIYGAVLCYRGPSLAKTIVKVLAVLPLAVLAFVQGGPMALTFALVACAIGDFFISRDGTPAFLLGMIAFAVGHLGFIALFAAFGSDVSNLQSLGRILGVILVSGAAIKWAPEIVRGAGQLKPFVMIYILIIVAMAVCALSLPHTPKGASSAVASLLFVGSDLLLGRQIFVQPLNHPFRVPISIAIWVLYWLSLMMLTIIYLF